MFDNTIEEVVTAPIEPEEEVEEEDSGGMSAAGKAFLWLFILLILIPCILLLIAFLIAKYKSETPIGQKINLRYTLFKQMIA